MIREELEMAKGNCQYKKGVRYPKQEEEAQDGKEALDTKQKKQLHKCIFSSQMSAQLVISNERSE